MKPNKIKAACLPNFGFKPFETWAAAINISNMKPFMIQSAGLPYFRYETLYNKGGLLAKFQI